QRRAYRRRLAQKARAARRQIDRNYQQLPQPVHTIFEPLAPALTRPTYHRLVVLALAAILTVGGRTIANLLRTLGALAPGHSSSSPPPPPHPPLSSPAAGAPPHRRLFGPVRPPRHRRAGRRRPRHRAARGQGLR